MTVPGSVTLWLQAVRTGNHAEAEDRFRRVWDWLHPLLIAFSLARLQGRRAGPIDAEDLADSAARILLVRERKGLLDRVLDRNDLVRHLYYLVGSKFRDLLERHRLLSDQCGQQEPADPRDGGLLVNVADRAPSPAAQAEVADTLGHLFGRLGDETSPLRRVAELKCDGYTNKEIAQLLGCSEPTVERRCRSIRQIWEREVGR